MCCVGLGVRVEDFTPKGHQFEFSLEQFLLKTKGVIRPQDQEYDRKNSNMVGKFCPWEQEIGWKKIRYGGKFPSVGEKRSSVAWIIQYYGTHHIGRDLTTPFLSVCVWDQRREIIKPQLTGVPFMPDAVHSGLFVIHTGVGFFSWVVMIQGRLGQKIYIFSDYSLNI